MSKKLYILCTITVIIITILSIIYVPKMYNKCNKNVIENDNIIDIQEDNIEQEESNNDNIQEEVKENIVVVESENKKEDNISTKTESKPELKKETSTNKNSNNSSTSNSNNTNSNKVEKPKEEVTIKQEKHPWDDLGISEYDYYNKPMWSWMKIDFDINKYGSQSATENACREYGNKKAEEESLGFSCTNVMSYSGKYLGEYIKFF